MSYVKSSLATLYPAYAGNYTPGRYVDYYQSNNPKNLSKVSEITIHHMSGRLTAAQCGSIFQAIGRGGSTHYGVGWDGSIGSYVSETDTAWGNSNWESNCRAISIETSNDINCAPWTVSDASLKSLIKLVADIAKRNNLNPLVKGKNLTWHRMYAATDCPGDYLLSKIDYIIAEVNKINSGTPTPAPTPAKPVSTPTKHAVNGTNIPRYADYLVQYKGKVTYTGTNPYGYEVAFDQYNVALKNPEYVGNSKVPTGGFVLSGHGEAGKWLKDNIRKGYRVVLKSGYCNLTKKQHKAFDGKNKSRGANELIVYTKGSTKTNPYGYEVAVVNGIAVSDPVYGKGNMTVPKNGYVLSGHLTDATTSGGKWIKANIKKGSKVEVTSKLIIVG